MKTILVFRTGTTGTWREKLAGITDFAKTEGWRLQTVDARSQLPDIEDLIDFWKPAGLILDASGDTDALDPAVFARTPCVSMTPSSDEFRRRTSTVRSSSSEIAAIAARELLRREVKTLAFLDAPGEPYWSTEKREAFRRLASLHGYALRVVAPCGLAQLPRPVGLFAATDALAAEALVAAEHDGMLVPDDLSVIGVDDDPEICESCEPTLTSIRPDFHQLGFSAAVLLRKRIESPRKKHESLEIPPIGLIRRASSTTHADSIISQVLEHIRQHACEGLTVAEVAKLFGSCSRRMAELRFRAATGKTMTEALLEARLMRAVAYLRDGKMSIFSVANFCGWKSDIPFRKAFKKRFGRSPKAVRRNLSSDSSDYFEKA